MSSLIPDEPVVPKALAQLWREACKAPASERRGYARFAARRRRPRVFPLAAVGRWVAMGMFLSVSSLYAASAAPWRWLGFSTVELAGGSNLPRPAVVPPYRAAPAAALVVEPVPSQIRSAMPSPSAEPLPSSSAPARHSKRPGTAALIGDDAAEQWQRAAQGLREGDFDGASSSLRELAHRARGPEREAAQLALAQLLLDRGREAEALRILGALRASAGSSSVRRKAGELLSGPREITASQRSSGGAAATHQP